MIKRFAFLAAPVLAISLLAAPHAAQASGAPVYLGAHGVSKGRPPGVAGVSTKSALTGPNFWYNEGNQTLSPAVTGAYANLTIISPATVSGDHSLAEIAISPVANTGNYVEVGVNRDFSLYGDNNPHLFVFSWINGVGQGYNGPGFVDYASNPINAGANLSSYLGGANKQFGIEFSSNAWWIAFDGSWVGYFPATNWSGASPSVTFTTTSYVQFFGEVASNSAAPCTDMGNGTLGTTTPTPTPPAARFTSAQYVGPASTAVLTYLNSPSVPTRYAVHSITSRSFDYGGPGFC